MSNYFTWNNLRILGRAQQEETSGLGWVDAIARLVFLGLSASAPDTTSSSTQQAKVINIR